MREIRPTPRPTFQSTPSARRATLRLVINDVFLAISIHALREEGDRQLHRAWQRRTYFNPRPPRGGRLGGAFMAQYANQFQSTPSARRATAAHDAAISVYNISIHALREEGDISQTATANFAMHFNPRPPRGGRLQNQVNALMGMTFQSTPSARRATAKTYNITP